MAPSPPPSPTPPHSNPSNKLDYYYFVVGLALVAIVLLVTNAIAVGCCSWFRQFLTARGLAPYDPSQEEVRRWIPSHKYRKKDRAGGEEGEGGTPECAVCLSPLDEGEEVRELPPCSHVFHAACIDMWLNSHTSCPICRGSVLPTPMDSMEMSARFQSQDNLLPPAATSSTAGGGGGGGGGGAGRFV